jgi:hypothetical protein
MVLERITAWQEDGLIDAATAERLRNAERAAGLIDETTADRPRETGASTAADAPAGRSLSVASAAGSFFGPPPSIMEVFAYLGAGFFIGAWVAFLGRIAGFENREAIIAGGTAILTAVLVGVGAVLRRGDARQRRGGGVALLVATSSAGIAATSLAQVAHVDYGAPTQILAFAAALAVALLGRSILPAVTTQVAVLGSLTGLAASVFSAIELFLSPASADCCIDSTPAVANPWLVVVLPAVGWLVVALLIGAIGLRESRSGDEPAQRRAAVSRFWAGLVAVAGVATAVLRQGYLGPDDYGRVIPPWLGEVILVVIALVLLERAFRRNSAAFLACSAIGLVIALTDFNFQYLTDSTDIGLLIEGAILLAVGIGADRLRRRLDRSRSAPASAGEPLDPAPAA